MINIKTKFGLLILLLLLLLGCSKNNKSVNPDDNDNNSIIGNWKNSNYSDFFDSADIRITFKENSKTNFSFIDNQYSQICNPYDTLLNNGPNDNYILDNGYISFLVTFNYVNKYSLLDFDVKYKLTENNLIFYPALIYTGFSSTLQGIWKRVIFRDSIRCDTATYEYTSDGKYITSSNTDTSIYIDCGTYIKFPPRPLPPPPPFPSSPKTSFSSRAKAANSPNDTSIYYYQIGNSKLYLYAPDDSIIFIK